MTFDETDFAKRVPKKILDRTKENMEVYNIGLYDSFKEAVGLYHKTANQQINQLIKMDY